MNEGMKKKKKKSSTKQTLEDPNEKVSLNVFVARELREWARKDAKRTGYNLADYIETLIAERREIAPPFEKVSLLRPANA